MWATLAVTAVLAAAPADAGPLQIKDEHFTYGILGSERKDTEVIPGDILILAFDIEGLTIKDDGTVRYTTAMELLDKDGKSEFKENPIERDGRQRPRRFASALLEPGKHRHRHAGRRLHRAHQRRRQGGRERPAGHGRAQVFRRGAAVRHHPAGTGLRQAADRAAAGPAGGRARPAAPALLRRGRFRVHRRQDAAGQSDGRHDA